MNNNLPKHRFFSRSVQLDLTKSEEAFKFNQGISLTLDKISLKKNIIKQLQNAIRQRFAVATGNSMFPTISPKLAQVLTSLSDKIILQDNIDSSSLDYSCAISFPLANLFGLSSLQVAQELVSLLTKNYREPTEEFTGQFTFRVARNGLIELSLSDRSIGLWLELGVRSWVLGDGEDGGDGEIGKWRDYNIFPVQYVYNRCCSLLLLGVREGLINLKDSDLQSGVWQIMNPNPFKYYYAENVGYRYESAELNLLRQISVIIDFIGDLPRGEALRETFGSRDRINNESQQNCKTQNRQTQVQLALNLSDACLKFIAAGRIFGTVAQKQRDLAIAKLGLIAIVQRYLQICIESNCGSTF